MPRKSKEGDREYHLIRTYGINEAKYQALLNRQHGTCAICLKKSPNGKRLYVDHDHKTGQIRGLLCATCNTFIGRVSEDPIVMSRASAYLRQFTPSTFEGVVKHVDLIPYEDK